MRGWGLTFYDELKTKLTAVFFHWFEISFGHEFGEIGELSGGFPVEMTL